MKEGYLAWAIDPKGKLSMFGPYEGFKEIAIDMIKSGFNETNNVGAVYFRQGTSADKKPDAILAGDWLRHEIEHYSNYCPELRARRA
jgi:hypothetical protein